MNSAVAGKFTNDMSRSTKPESTTLGCSCANPLTKKSNQKYENYFVTLLMRAALATSVVILRQKSQAQDTSPGSVKPRALR